MFIKFVQKVRFAGEEDDEAEEIGGKKEESKTTAAEQVPTNKKKSFFYDDAETEEWNVVELPTWGDRGIGGDEPMPAKAVKESCWQCYRMFPAVQVVKLATPNSSDSKVKQFCSDPCKDAFIL